MLVVFFVPYHLKLRLRLKTKKSPEMEIFSINIDFIIGVSFS